MLCYAMLCLEARRKLVDAQRARVHALHVVVGDPPGRQRRGPSQPAREHLSSIPSIAFDPKETPTTRAATVAFTVATYGINVPGTVYRMDDVPIPLRPAFESPHPSDLDVLQGIERRVRELKAAQMVSGG